MEQNFNKDFRIPRRQGKWTPKLTPEAKSYAISRLACDVKATQIVKEIKEKFNIDISAVRVSQLNNSKTGSQIYDIVRKKYLGELTKNAGTFVKEYINRLKLIEDYLEEVLIQDDDDWSTKKAKIELAVKLLKTAQDEDKKHKSTSVNDLLPKSSSMMQFVQSQTVNINPEPVQKEVKVIEVQGESLEPKKNT
jgi:hypothetical protein